MRRSILFFLIALLIPAISLAEPFVTDPASTGMVMASNGDGEHSIPYRLWTGSDFTSENNISADFLDGSQVQYVVVKASTKRDQTVVGVLDDDGDILFNIYNITNNSWGSWVDVANIGRTNDNFRGFGMEVEQESGDFLVVYENLTTANRLAHYMTWDGSQWSPEGTIDLNSNVANEAQTIIRLENAPAGDEILAGIIGGSDDLSVARWNGSEWVNVTSITLTAAAVDEERFSIVYEQKSHDAMVAWGNSTSAIYMILDNTSKTWGSQGEIRNRNASVNQITLCADPNSDYVGASIGPDSNSDLLFVIWNGSEWLSGEPSEETSIEDVAVPNAYCSWTSTTNTSLFTFVNDAALSISYLIYNRSSGMWTCSENNQNVTNLESAEGSNGPCNTGNVMSDDIEVLRSAKDPLNDNIMLWGNDLSEDSEMFIFNSTHIIQPNTALLETLTTTSSTVEPVWFAYDKYFDTCHYDGSGNWNIDCSENCTISRAFDLFANNVTITGVGSMTFYAQISGWKRFIWDNTCRIDFQPGGRVG